MIRNLIVYINSDRSVFPKELKIANQFEIKTNEIKFIFDGDIPRTGYPYLILTNRNGSFYLPLVDDSVVFGNQETWIMGGWSAHIMISEAEIINGIVNKSEKLFISDDFGLWVEPSDINIDDLKEQQIPTPLKLLYDDLFALKERVEEILDGGLSDGKDGVDGVSPTVSVSKSGKVTTITINDVEGTKTATINDGLDGKDGSNGQNGKDGTSVTVSNVSESTADGGSNVVTFSDGKSITIKNGSKGSKGDSGQDGADGHTPVKGVDYFDGQNGKDGQDGKDGVSISSVTQTTTSSEDGGTNIVQVTLSNGNKSSFQVKNGSKGSKGDKGNPGDAGYTPVKGVDYFDGVDGKDGQNGSNGKDGTSVTVKSVSESTADGGSNVVTFSDGKTVTIKNGSKGSKGDKGDTGPTGPAYTLTASDKAAITASVKSEIDPKLDELKESKANLSHTHKMAQITDLKVPTKTSELTNDSGFLTEHQDLSAYAKTSYVDSEIDTLKAQGIQQVPLYANSVEECTDTTKLYVLPDGFIYAYKFVESTGPSYTNLSETVHENYRMGSGGTLSALTGAVVTDFIPVKKGQTVLFKGFNPLVMPESKYPYICFYTNSNESSVVDSDVWFRLDWLKEAKVLKQDNNGVWSYTAFLSAQGSQHTYADSIKYIRMCGTMISGETVIVTVDEEITEGGSSGYQWVSTGHAFVSADYETEITALQKNKANKTDIPSKLPNPNALTIDGQEYDGSEPVNIETQSGGNILYGKKWVACGDSFTHGGYNASDGFNSSVYVYQEGKYTGENIVYPFIIGLRNNMEIVNLASGGQTMAVSSNSFMSVYQNIDSDADYITIMLGINDKVQGLTVGELEDSVNTTFCGAFNIAMEHILENHPFAHVGIMVSHGTNEEIMEATRGIAERWGVPYLDYGSPQVPLMNRYTGRNVCAKAQQIREKNFCINSDGTTPVNAHPNTKAHEYESTFIEAWLRTL